MIEDGFYRVIETIHILNDTGNDFEQLFIPAGKIVGVCDNVGICDEIKFPSRLIRSCEDQLRQLD